MEKKEEVKKEEVKKVPSEGPLPGSVPPKEYVFVGNTKHDGVFYKKGSEAKCSSDMKRTWLANGIIMEKAQYEFEVKAKLRK